ncbi:MAG: YdiU family protein [Candidatus Manganitrophaceae bacterium]|nr:MAG: YdiU family protein [Candidatus Manganitrophaceae bacterium]
MRTVETLQFDHSFARLPGAFYTRLFPTPLPTPYLVHFNEDAAGLIDLHPKEAARPEFIDYFSGNRLLPGSEPLAMLYSGHQFGVYVPQLGDGRAILLGEVRNQAGERWEMQLKGAGRTPYSRDGDGRAVLRSTIREYLCGEAMQGLGIPTTRALSIVGSDQKIFRETVETAAVLLRLAPSHVRFGSFQIFYYRRQHELLRTLADYVIAHHFPALAEKKEKHALFLMEVVLRTARLMAEWQAVGFAHGVMNTDNMSILGLTFDYGPFGFVEAYDPGFICNHSDHIGRYAFNRQPQIGLWNLSALAQSLTPLISKEAATEALDQYEPVFNAHYTTLMARKLGLKEFRNEDVPLLLDLLRLLQSNKIDYTHFFRALGNFKQAPGERNSDLRARFIDIAAFDAWAERYRSRLLADTLPDAERKRAMDRINPKYILRNYLAQIAIRKATEERDYTEIGRLLHLLRRPFDEQPEMARYAEPPPDWAKEIQVSCSS